MKDKESIIVWVALLILMLFAAVVSAGCTYTNPNPFPNPLVLNNGDTLCVTRDTTVNTALTVKSGAYVMITGAVFHVNGSMAVQGNAKVHVNDCGSKLEITGSYAGSPSKCEIYWYCDTCDLATGQPYELIAGANAWQEWCCQTPLPVELLEFYGNNHYNYNIIQWTTGSEINNDYFTLERSEDGELWGPIALVKGSNGFTMQHYDYLDYKITKSYYYRLKQTNFNGSYEYLSITVVTYRADNKVRRELFRITPSGRSVGTGHKGVIIKIYDDGSSEKVIN